MIWLLYARFTNGAQKPEIEKLFDNLCADIKKSFPSGLFRIDEVNCKSELFACINEVCREGSEITEWHFVGHGTPYGPLLGSPEWPEEISPYEWKTIRIPFSAGAKAWFYMEDSASWLAPYLSTVFSITSYGCHQIQGDMTAFPPGFWSETADYDPIASLYANTFSDITVRRDECRWLEKKLLQQRPGKVLDIGCGNGALLAYLSPKIKQGSGVDISSSAIKIAADNYANISNLSFTAIDGPHLPFEDKSFDTIISMLSFRYLDWDPIIQEMKRVAAPGAHILIVDMVSSPLKPNRFPFFIKDKLKNAWFVRQQKHFKTSLNKLVNNPDWKRMLSQHPMHRQDEFELYMKSRFPLGKVSILNTGWKAKILSFDSGPFNEVKGILRKEE